MTYNFHQFICRYVYTKISISYIQFENIKSGACNGGDGGQVNPRMKQYIMDYSCPLIETDVQILLQYHHLLTDLCIQAA